MSTNKCTRCDGCGRIADSEDGEPWTSWTSLPLASSAAVLYGLVKPIPCPVCAGSGNIAPPPKAMTPLEQLQAWVDEDEPGREATTTYHGRGNGWFCELTDFTDDVSVSGIGATQDDAIRAALEQTK